MDDAYGLVAKLMKRCEAKGHLTLPALPAMGEHYVSLLVTTFQALGCPFTEVEREQLRGLINARLEEAFGLSPASYLEVSYERNDSADGVYYSVGLSSRSVAEQYASWQAARRPELFGKHPDAKLMQLASNLPAGAKCLDLGAGAGRNSIGLARLGHQVDAVELTPELAQTTRDSARRLQLPLNVIEGDVLDDDLPLDDQAYALIVVSEVTSHFRDTDDLGALMQRIQRSLAPGGKALVNVFLVADPALLTPLLREAAEVLWATFFARSELELLAETHGLRVVSDEPVLEFERNHAAEGTWPPTAWYESWAAAEDVFEGPAPIDVSFRWITLERRAGDPV